jgi:hypothetical protein
VRQNPEQLEQTYLREEESMVVMVPTGQESVQAEA